jgi:hypothetical protein
MDRASGHEVTMAKIPTQVTFRGLRHSAALESEIQELADWLEQFYPGIVRCRVLLELPHRHRRAGGRHFHVRVELTVPGGAPLVVSHQPSVHGDVKASEGAYHKETENKGVSKDAGVAIRQAFATARRRLEDFARTQRGDVKTTRP